MTVSMKQNVRRYAVLVLVQAACLALGLWLEHRFVAFAARAEAETPAPSTKAAAESAVHEPNGSAAAVNQLPLGAVRAIVCAWIAVLQAGVAWLVLARGQEAAAREKNKADSVSLQRYNDLLRTRDAVIFGLAKLAESRDPDTGNHLERIAIYSTRLASALRRNSRYRNQISAQFVQLIGISSSLHDIGKVGIADAILLKPGRFEEQERMVMQMHVAIGGKCVQDIETRLGQSNFLQMARQIALCHHERWDGTGYPEGLAGEEIPLAARIVAVADVYDALAMKRVYKEAISHAHCVEMIRKEAGRHFDPVVVEAFLEIESEFQDIVKRCAEPNDANVAGHKPVGRSEKAAATGDEDEDVSAVLDLLAELAADSSSAVQGTSPRVKRTESNFTGRGGQGPVDIIPAADLSNPERETCNAP